MRRRGSQHFFGSTLLAAAMTSEKGDGEYFVPPPGSVDRGSVVCKKRLYLIFFF